MVPFLFFYTVKQIYNIVRHDCAACQLISHCRDLSMVVLSKAFVYTPTPQFLAVKRQCVTTSTTLKNTCTEPDDRLGVKTGAQRGCFRDRPGSARSCAVQ